MLERRVKSVFKYSERTKLRFFILLLVKVVFLFRRSTLDSSRWTPWISRSQRDAVKKEKKMTFEQVD